MAVLAIAADPIDMVPFLEADDGVGGFTLTQVGGRYDSSYVDGAFSVRHGSSRVRSRRILPSALLEFRFHCRYYADNAGVSATSQPVFEFGNSSSGFFPQFVCCVPTAGVLNFRTRQSGIITTLSGPGTFAFTATTLTTLDFHIKIDPSAGFIRVWSNGTQVVNFSGAVPAEAGIDYFAYGAHGISNSHDWQFSETYIADNATNTVGTRVKVLTPNAQGALNEFAGPGSFDDINDFDFADFKAHRTEGSGRSTYSFPNLTGSDVFRPVYAVQPTTRIFLDKTGTALVSARQVLRETSGTVTSGGSLLTWTADGDNFCVIPQETCPSTGLPWNASNLNNIELGVEALT